MTLLNPFLISYTILLSYQGFRYFGNYEKQEKLSQQQEY